MAVGCHKKAFDHPISRLHSRSFNFRLLFRHKYGYWIQFFSFSECKSKSENICVKGEINELLKGHSKKYLGDFPKVTKQKVGIGLSLHPFSVSSGNFLVAFGGSW